MSEKKIEEYLEKVKNYQKELSLLSEISSLLGWDEATYMPEKGQRSRAEQKAHIEKIIHNKMNSEELWEYTKRLKNAKEKLKKRDKIMIKKLYRDLWKSRQLPEKFVEEFSRATSKGFNSWQKAKKENDFNIFKPHLKKIVELSRKKSEYINLPGHPYNSLIDDFEEGMTTKKLESTFKDLKKELMKIIEKTEKENVNVKINYKKRNMKKHIAKELGFSLDNLRIDISSHPFTTTIGNEDVRITTKREDGTLFPITSTIHELGHALHDLNIPKKEKYTVLGDSPSFGISESQSRIWENNICKSRSFWKYFSKNFNNNLEELYKEANAIKPTTIRIKSDELYYCLHIILRFELEKELIEGKIEVEELPRLWNEKTKNIIGMKPKNNKEGILQDVHWSLGYFGYFPSYALGSIYASQLYSQMKKEMNIDKKVEKGEFKEIREWLKEKIHKHGRKYNAEEIINNVCGEGLNQKKYIKYLEKKYLNK